MSSRKLILFSLTFLFRLSASAQELAKPVDGVLDLRARDFKDSPKISLDGDWNFYWNQLLSFREAEKKEATTIAFSIPWNEQVGKPFPAEGYATYTLQIYLPKGAPPLAMEVPAFYNSYRLIVNDKIISENGKVGIDKNSTAPYWRSYFKDIESGHDTVNVVLQISNFHHSRGGANLPIHLGASDSLKNSVSLSNLVTKVLCAILFGISLFAIFYRRNRKAALYFSVMCFSWMTRVLFSNQYLFHEFIDLSWLWAVRIEYLSFLFTVVFGTLYISSLYPTVTPIIIKYFLLIVNGAFIFIILMLAPATFTKYVGLFLAVAAVTILFVFFVVLKALVYDRSGAWLSVSSFLMLGTVFSYNIIAYLENFDVNIIALYGGFLISFLLNGYALYYKTIHNDKSDMLTFEDLYGKKLN
jgi:7TM diverse intracellular signalling